MDELDQVLVDLVTGLGEVTTAPVALDGGITNRNYRVFFASADCVVRLPGKDTGLLGISREAERLATQTAAALGIAPRLVTGDDRCLVTEYVGAAASDAESIRAAPEPVAAALRRFHESGLELPIRFWVPELLDAYADVVRARGGGLPELYEEAREVTHRIARALPLTHAVPCHNDLLPANVLRAPGERVLLVDWEYAGMGHRMFDLGNLAANSALDEADERRLLAAYLGREPITADYAALRLMRIMSDAREAAWGVVQGRVSELTFDFNEYADRHLRRFREAADDPRMEEWLVAAAT